MITATTRPPMNQAPHTLLINPTITSRSSARFPLSLLHLSTSLDRAGSSRIIDGNMDRDFVQQTLQALDQGHCTAVGISVMGGPQIEPAIEVSRAIRDHRPDVQIGRAHV